MFTVIDLFSRFGGLTRGGVDAGLQVLWAANHWSAAVEWHTKNNPDKNHSETKKAYAVKRKPLIFMVRSRGRIYHLQAAILLTSSIINLSTYT